MADSGTLELVSSSELIVEQATGPLNFGSAAPFSTLLIGTQIECGLPRDIYQPRVPVTAVVMPFGSGFANQSLGLLVGDDFRSG